MRNVLPAQLKLSQTDISAIYLDPKSRDDIPQLLRGLQHIYVDLGLRQRVFAILQGVRPTRKNGEGKADPEVGRPGMAQWVILVLGTLRLVLNADYDRIVELANQHSTLRQMLGHGRWDDEYTYELQTVKDNIRLFSPEILSKINEEVVTAGHEILRKNGQMDEINARADSFVVETNVHYPTDINLLYDSIRKTIELCNKLSIECDLTEWRQSAYNISKFKKQYRHIQLIRHSTSKDEVKRDNKEDELRGAYVKYIEMAKEYLAKAEDTCDRVFGRSTIKPILFAKLRDYMGYARQQVSLIDKRILRGEVIPHDDKVFSIFEPHTEWISKGKAGVPVELGLRVCIVEDQSRFILHHKVMVKQTDDQVTVEVAQHTVDRYPQVKSISYDKGFHSPENQKELKELVERVVLPRKGKLSEKSKADESDPEFKRLRRKHSAVESGINALEVHGLDTCPDHGLIGFERYVALAVLGRNIHRLGAVLEEQEARKRPHINKIAA